MPWPSARSRRRTYGRLTYEDHRGGLTLDDCKQYVVTYNHAGAQWSVLIWARDEADCRRRMYAISVGTVDGELVMTLPGYTGPLARIIVAVRNFFSRMLR